MIGAHCHLEHDAYDDDLDRVIELCKKDAKEKYYKTTEEHLQII